jgi:hypothetical protein
VVVVIALRLARLALKAATMAAFIAVIILALVAFTPR